MSDGQEDEAADVLRMLIKQPAEAEVVEMKEEEIVGWKSFYNSRRNMEEWIKQGLDDLSSSNRAAQLPFVPVLAQIALMRHDVEKFVKGDGEYYRWLLRYEGVMSGIISHCDNQLQWLNDRVEEEKRNVLEAGGNFFLPDGFSYVFQLKVKGVWKDWVYVACSTRRTARFGLFAARDFPCNSIIGFYIGPSVWCSSLAGGAEPPERLTPATVSKNALAIRNPEAKFEIVDPKAIGNSPEDEAVPLYMGMHFINNACEDFRPGTTDYDKASKKNNCMLIEDGSVKACKKIYPRQELLCGYLRDEHNLTQEKKKEAKKKKEEEEQEDSKPAASKKRKSKK